MMKIIAMQIPALLLKGENKNLKTLTTLTEWSQRLVRGRI